MNAPNDYFAVRVYKEYFNFAAGHFLIFGDGSREPLHGHNYKVEVDIQGEPIAGDLVIDFIELKPIVRNICDSIDHHVIFPRQSPHLTIREEGNQIVVVHSDGSEFSFPKQDVLLLDIPNTSTEMLARYIAEAILKELPTRIPDARVQRLTVSVEESPGQCGIYSIAL